MDSRFEIIDLTYLDSIAEGNISVIREFISIFLEQADEFQEGLERYFSNKQWKELGALAHKAKSSVISMGMTELGNCELKNLELIAKQFRIKELKKLEVLTPKEVEELNYIQKQFDSFPADKKQWIIVNTNTAAIEKIISKYNTICNKAIKELKVV
jgi:hypothetical protein